MARNEHLYDQPAIKQLLPLLLLLLVLVLFNGWALVVAPFNNPFGTALPAAGFFFAAIGLLALWAQQHSNARLVAEALVLREDLNAVTRRLERIRRDAADVESRHRRYGGDDYQELEKALSSSSGGDLVERAEEIAELIIAAEKMQERLIEARLSNAAVEVSRAHNHLHGTILTCRAAL